MKLRVITPLLSCIILLFGSSCNPPSSAEDYEPIVLTGSVVNHNNNNALDNAIVRIIQPFDRTTLTDGNGLYDFELDVDSTITLTITANKEGFLADTTEVLAIPERDIELPTFRLVGTDEESDDNVSTGGPGSISLVSVTPEHIVVQGSGGEENATFIFQVNDSSGHAINVSNPVDVSFRLGSHPDGGEMLNPVNGKTDGEGRVSVNLRSGTIAGVVQVIAEVNQDELLSSLENEDSGTVLSTKETSEAEILSAPSSGGDSSVAEVIRSQPVSIVIHGGLPDQGHFSVSPTQFNFPGYNINGLTNEISVIVGDKYGNIVAPGTAVYFSTDGGVIEGSSKTDDKGIASVELKSGNPRPDHPDLGPGFATIYAHTADDANNRVEDEAIVLFSGLPEIEISSPGGNSRDYTYRVHDQNGNPLAPETTISVNIDGEDVEVSGDTEITLGDTYSKGSGTTDFSFRVTGEGNEYLVNIDVEGPNGKASASTGRTDEGGQIGGPGSGEAASIKLASVSEESITVRESSEVENAEFIFQILDDAGNPIDANAAADVNFSLGSNPGGGISLFPATARTDAAGQVAVNLRSGTTAGVVQVIAEVDGSSIKSKPVSISIHAGLPDQAHFAVASEVLNLPGLNIFGLSTAITAFVGDKYGNIVSPGTSVYFTTDGGFVEGSAKTDERGRATVELTATNPNPPGGFATVRAQTADENSAIIETSTTVLFSGSPNIEINPATINVTNLGGQSFDYNVSDENGNPLAEGTNIVVNVETPDDDLGVIGEVDITLGDSQQSGPGTTDFQFSISDTGEDILARDVQITIVVTSPNGGMTRTITGSKVKSTL
ncbi:MAG: Ig-like domain-containing protein [Balneolales bacterium]